MHLWGSYLVFSLTLTRPSPEFSEALLVLNIIRGPNSLALWKKETCYSLNWIWSCHCWLKSSIIWDVMPCSLVRVSRCCYLLDYLLGLLLNPEDTGSTFLRNILKLLPDYIASHLNSALHNHLCQNPNLTYLRWFATC
jgi:hypothetical protein